MILIKNMDLDIIAQIDDALGYRWRQGKLPDGAPGCAHVVLGDNTILKAYDTHINLDCGARLVSVHNKAFEEVVIK